MAADCLLPFILNTANFQPQMTPEDADQLRGKGVERIKTMSMTNARVVGYLAKKQKKAQILRRENKANKE